VEKNWREMWEQGEHQWSCNLTVRNEKGGSRGLGLGKNSGKVVEEEQERKPTRVEPASLSYRGERGMGRNNLNYGCQGNWVGKGK